jgi:hypothetical protein
MMLQKEDIVIEYTGRKTYISKKIIENALIHIEEKSI